MTVWEYHHMRLGREGQLALLPKWVSEKLDVHLWETNRLLAPVSYTHLTLPTSDLV